MKGENPFTLTFGQKPVGIYFPYRSDWKDHKYV